MVCTCYIVPKDVLARLERDASLPPRVRQAAANTERISEELRRLRTQAGRLTAAARVSGGHLTRLAASPKITVYDCKHTQTLPGAPIATPKQSKDQSVKRAFTQTTKLAQFYKTVFKRNSVDDAGMTLMSSVHYGVDFNNAMWNGSQMVYGDGDGRIFVDFTKGIDVIGHELTHGVTQHSLQLGYTDDAGGLNESLSDCFGAMFEQWELQQTVNKASWLIGKAIMGPTAKAKGYTALRSMLNPGSTACLAPQPTQYSKITKGMDPHLSSGPPNLAFCTACRAAGGQSWEGVGQVWYAAMTTSGVHPTMTMPQFAARTRQIAGQLFSTNTAIAAAIDQGWKKVGL